MHTGERRFLIARVAADMDVLLLLKHAAAMYRVDVAAGISVIVPKIRTTGQKKDRILPIRRVTSGYCQTSPEVATILSQSYRFCEMRHGTQFGIHIVQVLKLNDVLRLLISVGFLQVW